MTETLEQDVVETKKPLSLKKQKAELAELYLSFLDSKKDGVLGTAAGMWMSLNPLKETAKKYLLSQDKKKWFFEKLTDNVKNVLIKKVSKDSKLNLEYDTKELDSMRRILEQADTQEKLETLKKQIEAWKMPTELSDTGTIKTDVSDNKESSKTIPFVAPVLAATMLTPTLKAIREKIEIHEDFANIKEIKNADGKKILECTAETPYINLKALDDLLAFADAFYQKTGQALTLNSAYRTIDHQKKLKATNQVPTAEPGESGHNLGLSIDIEKNDKNEKAVGWLQGFRELAKQYNFNPIKSEDWHFDHDVLPKPDERLAIAQSLDHEFQEERLAA